MARRRTTTRSALMGALIAAVGAAAGTGAVLAARVAYPGQALAWAGGWGWVFAVMAGAAVFIGAVWSVIAILDTHFDDLERLRAGLIVAAGGPGRGLPALRADGRNGAHDDAACQLWRAADELMAARLSAAGVLEGRLSAVLASLDEAIVVVSEDGLVQLVNLPAKAMLGAARVAAGTSVFAALERAPLVQAMAAADAAAGAVNWTLEDVDGNGYEATVAVLKDRTGTLIRLGADRIQGLPDGWEDGYGIDHDLTPAEVRRALADLPALTPDTPLTALPVFVFDAETTGLDVAADRIISMGGVRVLGGHILRADVLDRLVCPGVPIPPGSTRIHGITDAMVEGQAPFAEAYPAYAAMADGFVLVGHNVGFDAAILKAEAARADIAFALPPMLDTLQLCAAMFPAMTDLNLETLADRLGVDVHGRHTALGDALVTAEVYVRLLPLLAEAGVSTLEQAQAFGASATRVTARQDALGWAKN